MRVALIDYGAGNLRSVQNALRRLNIEPIITSDPAEIRQADRVIFPGVGHADTAMKSLQAKGLDKLIPSLEQPVLGICLGMQLLCKSSEEGEKPGLGILDERVRKFKDAPKSLHMGWNATQGLKTELFEGIAEGSHFYYVHGYYVPETKQSIGNSAFGEAFVAAVQQDNFYGVQFHPEKSGPTGARVLANFLNLTT